MGSPFLDPQDRLSTTILGMKNPVPFLSHTPGNIPEWLTLVKNDLQNLPRLHHLQAEFGLYEIERADHSSEINRGVNEGGGRSPWIGLFHTVFSSLSNHISYLCHNAFRRPKPRKL